MDPRVLRDRDHNDSENDHDREATPKRGLNPMGDLCGINSYNYRYAERQNSSCVSETSSQTDKAAFFSPTHKGNLARLASCGLRPGSRPGWPAPRWWYEVAAVVVVVLGWWLYWCLRCWKWWVVGAWEAGKKLGSRRWRWWSCWVGGDVDVDRGGGCGWWVEASGA